MNEVKHEQVLNAQDAKREVDAKTQPTEAISKIIRGTKDPNGYEIVDVLAKGNEYAIYEISHDDINCRLRVYIDGFTNDSETKLANRFAQVKQKYIEAKGLLYRTSNFGMMKNRVAHALATTLTTDDVDGVAEFDTLIESIKKEATAVVYNRIFYLLPVVICLCASFIVACYFMKDRIAITPCWQISIVALGSLLGGGLSILSKTNNLHFEEYSSKWHYFLFGLERVLLALVAGAIAFSMVKARLIFTDITKSNYWSLMSIIVVSGFSEILVPSFLEKMVARKQTKGGDINS